MNDDQRRHAVVIELIRIEDDIDDLELERLRLLREQENIQRELDTVLHQLHNLKTRKAQLTSHAPPVPVLSAVHRLPDDVLQRIFTYCLEEGPHRPGHYDSQSRVSHVCRKWRDVAIRTPWLWTSIDMNEGPPYERTEVWLERSAPFLLDIQLRLSRKFSMEYVDLDNEGLEEALSVLIPHVSRWQHFSLMVDTFELMHTALRFLRPISNAPYLQSLKLCQYGEVPSVRDLARRRLLDPVPIFAKADMRNLAHACLSGIPIAWEPTLSHLTVLELAYHPNEIRPSFRQFATMLTSSNLTTLYLRDSGFRVEHLDGRVIRHRPIHAPALRSLTFAHFDPIPLYHVASVISAPGLLSLTLEDLDGGDYSPFLGMVAPFFPALENLEMDAIECNEESAYRFLRAFPHLTRLDMDLTTGHPAFHYALTNHERKIVCPTLTEFTSSGWDSRTLRMFVEDRHGYYHAGGRIELIRIDEKDSRFMAPQDLAWLREHVEVEFFGGSVGSNNRTETPSFDTESHSSESEPSNDYGYAHEEDDDEYD